MAKTPEGLQEIASMVKETQFRTPVKTKETGKVIPLNIMASEAEPEIRENSNLNHGTAKSGNTAIVASLTSGLRRSAHTNSR